MRGDRVAVNAITPCYQCELFARLHLSMYRDARRWKFANVKDGNLAEYFHVNSAQANLATIPPSLTDEQVAYCTDMMSTGFMGAEHANVPVGVRSGCLRAGTSRTDSHRGARLLGPAWSFAVEVVPQRKEARRKSSGPMSCWTSRTGSGQSHSGFDQRTEVNSSIEALRAQEPSSLHQNHAPRRTISILNTMAKEITCRCRAKNGASGWATKVIRTGLCPGGAGRRG